MTSQLHWRDFDKSRDRATLRSFVCTDPEKKAFDGKRKTHPAPWEHEVQCAVREHSPSKRDGEAFILGFDEDERLGAASAWSHYEDPGRALLQLIAVAMHHRHCGGAVAKDVMTVTLDRLGAYATDSDASRLLVEAHIHPKNVGSKRLCSDAGFVFDSMFDDTYDLWARYQTLLTDGV